MNFKKLCATILTIATAISATSCNLLHSHTFSNEYSFDETHHWKQATCDCEVVGDKNEHNLANGENTRARET